MEDSVGRIDRSADHLSHGENGNLATLASARTVALIDVSRLRRECLRLALAQHNAHWRVVEFANAEELQRALEGGAPNADLALIGALDLVLAGGVYVPSSLLDAAPPRQDGSSDRPSEPWSELTRRQRDVLGLISQGKSNKLIADALSMSESTVKAHVKQIIKRLHVSNRTQAALLATGHGPFPLPNVMAQHGHGAIAK